MRARRLLAVLALAGLAAGAWGCFSPEEPPCAFTCHKGICPAPYACGSDGYCHREGDAGACPLAPGGDGGAGD